MKTRIFRYSLFALLITGITLSIYRDAFDPTALEAWVKDASPAGPILFMLTYALGAVSFLPGSALTGGDRANPEGYAGPSTAPHPATHLTQ